MPGITPRQERGFTSEDGPPEGGPYGGPYAVVIDERYHSTVCLRPSSNDTIGV